MSECAGGQTYHQFEPRYSSEPISLDLYGAMNSLYSEIHHKKTYVYDICTRCGKTVTPKSNDEKPL